MTCRTTGHRKPLVEKALLFLACVYIHKLPFSCLYCYTVRLLYPRLYDGPAIMTYIRGVIKLAGWRISQYLADVCTVIE